MLGHPSREGVNGSVIYHESMSADFGRSRVPGDILRDGMPGDMFRSFRSTKVDCQFAAHLQLQ